MRAVEYIPIGDEVFTTALLDENFRAFAEYTQQMATVVSVLDEQVQGLTAQVATLAKKAPKNRFTPFVVGAVAGVLIYRTALNNRLRIQRFADELKKDSTIKTESERV